MLQKNMRIDPGNILIAHRHLNVEIGSEAALLPEKEYVNGIFVAVQDVRVNTNFSMETFLGDMMKNCFQSCRLF